MTNDELRDWEPSERALADLQCLARRFSKVTGIQKKLLAEMAASQISSTLDRSPEAAGLQERIAVDFENFMGRWNESLLTRFRPYAHLLVQTIIKVAQARPLDRNAAYCARLATLLARHENFRELTDASAFMMTRNSFRSGELKSAERKKEGENNLFVAFNQLAIDFNDYSQDIHLGHDRFKTREANGGARPPETDGAPVGGRFVLIRRSSRAPETFVSHGLLIDRHTDDKRVLYFSEQLRTLEDGVETNRRQTQGVCIFDGRNMTAIARPRYNTYFTYVAARIDDVAAPLDWFSAIIMTANRDGARISAEALCLRCESFEDRERKQGLFTATELRPMYSGAQRKALDQWLSRPPAAALML